MPDKLPRARRLRRPAPRRLRRRSPPSASTRLFLHVSSGRRIQHASGDAADRYFAAADSFWDSGRVASRPGYPAEPASGLGPSGGYPSRLRPLRGLRAPLARRFAALTAACLAAAVAQRAGIRVLPPPRSALALPRLPWPAAPASGCASARRRSHSRTPPCGRRAAARPLTRRGGSPPVPIPEPVPPTFGTLGRVLPTPFGGSALTPHAAGCTSRHETLRYPSATLFVPVSCREKRSHFGTLIRFSNNLPEIAHIIQTVFRYRSHAGGSPEHDRRYQNGTPRRARSASLCPDPSIPSSATHVAVYF